MTVLRFPPPASDGVDGAAAGAAAAAELKEGHGVGYVALAGYLMVIQKGGMRERERERKERGRERIHQE